MLCSLHFADRILQFLYFLLHFIHILCSLLSQLLQLLLQLILALLECGDLIERGNLPSTSTPPAASRDCSTPPKLYSTSLASLFSCTSHNAPNHSTQGWCSASESVWSRNPLECAATVATNPWSFPSTTSPGAQTLSSSPHLSPLPPSRLGPNSRKDGTSTRFQPNARVKSECLQLNFGSDPFETYH